MFLDKTSIAPFYKSKAILLSAMGLALGLSVSQVKAQDALVSYQALSPELALRAAKGAMDGCRNSGYQISVAVVDRFGLPQVVLRDRFAGAHTVETATRKAWTAASFKTNTVELEELTAQPENSALRLIPNALALGGGVYIENGDGSLLGGIGVSGAPVGSIDHDCALDGVSAIEDDILF